MTYHRESVEMSNRHVTYTYAYVVTEVLPPVLHQALRLPHRPHALRLQRHLWITSTL
jgi:hypothetical protein